MPRRPGTKLRVVPKPSAPAKPKPVFAAERFFELAKDLKPLMRKHWLELGRDRNTVPLDFNWDAYAHADANGAAKFYTIRLNDQLIGYAFVSVAYHLHYKSTLHASIDTYWLDPDYRKGWTGVAFVRFIEGELRALGVVRVMTTENVNYKNKRGRRTRTLWQALGYTATDVHFRKLL